MKKSLTVVCLLFTASASHADPFRNLGFDEAVATNLVPNPPGPPGGAGPVSDLLSGWQLSIGANPIAGIGYNQDFLDTVPFITLLTPEKANFAGYVNLRIDGLLGLLIYEDAFKQDHFSLKQTGDVPFNAKLLTFSYAGTPLNVSINGAPIGSTFPGSATTITESFDVSAYAGQNVTLSFDGYGDPISRAGGSYFLDNISFQVPEPGTVTLFGLGGGALLAAGLRRRRA